MGRRNVNIDRVLEEVTKRPDGVTALEVSIATGLFKSPNVHRAIRYLRSVNKVYIDRWERRHSKHRWSAVWRLGDLDDCPKPPSVPNNWRSDWKDAVIAECVALGIDHSLKSPETVLSMVISARVRLALYTARKQQEIKT